MENNSKRVCKFVWTHKKRLPHKISLRSIDRYLLLLGSENFFRVNARFGIILWMVNGECAWAFVPNGTNQLTIYNIHTQKGHPKTPKQTQWKIVFCFSLFFVFVCSVKGWKQPNKTSNDSTNRSLKTTKNKRPHYSPVIEVHEDSSAIHTNLQHIRIVIAIGIIGDAYHAFEFTFKVKWKPAKINEKLPFGVDISHGFCAAIESGFNRLKAAKVYRKA